MWDWFKSLLGIDPLAALEVAKTGGRKRNPAFQREAKKFVAENPYCSWCGGKEYLQVHHIYPFAKYPWMEMMKEFWVVLCEPPGYAGCHLREGHLGSFEHGYDLSIRERCEQRQRLVLLRESGGIPPQVGVPL